MRVAIVAVAAVVLLGAGVAGVASHKHRKCSGNPARCTRPKAKPSPKPGVYVAERARGSGRGTRCSNAHGADWFNDPAHWVAQPGRARPGGRIRPGVTVYLCGTIATPLRAQGGGLPGQPVMIYWMPGAALSSPTWGEKAAFSTNGYHDLTLNGGGHGIIEATALGSDLPGRGQHAVGINARYCNGCTIENLTIANLYVHSSASDSSVDQSMDDGIVFSGSGLTIANNTIHDVGWGLYAIWGNGDRNVSIRGNDVYDVDHGFASTSGFRGGSIGPVLFFGNHVHDYANWDTSDDAYHHDGVHCYTSDGGAGAAHYDGLFIFDNTFDGSTGADMTAQVFVEGGSGSGATPCADSSSQIWIFNNVGSVSRDVYNGVFGVFSGSPRVLNNTLIGANTRSGIAYSTGNSVTSEDFRNNVISTSNQLIAVSGQISFAPGAPNHNVYANGGNNSFVCRGNYYSFGEFGRWKACVGGDSGSRRAATARLSPTGVPKARSAVSDRGANLTYLCQGRLRALCRDRVGTPRPARGPWNAGAY